MKRQQILDAAAQAVLVDRQTIHGSPEDSFKTIAALWNTYLLSTSTPIRKFDVAVMMCLMKIARISKKSGNADSWVDVAGYAACGGELSETEGLQACNSATGKSERDAMDSITEEEAMEASTLAHTLQFGKQWGVSDRSFFMDCILRPTTLSWNQLNKLRNLSK